MSEEYGYNMGVFLCLGQQIHSLSCNQANDITNYKSFKDIHEELESKETIFILLGSSMHKIKKKAEQVACNQAIITLSKFI